MFEVWQSVQVKNPNHPRGNKTDDPAQSEKGQAGVVFATDPSQPDEVAVRFDTDGRTELVAVADLKAL